MTNDMTNHAFMATKLLNKCDVCNSWFWCGRACGRAPEKALASVVITDDVTDSASPTYKYRDPVKWRAYMKEYMRKRRAKSGDNADDC